MSTAAKKKPAAKGTKPAAKPAAAKGKTAAKPAAKPAAAAPKKPPKEYPEMKIELKQMAAVIKDEEGTIKKSGRWPLLVDLQGQASTFLRYQDANCVSCLDQEALQPDRLRLTVLGALRFGKPVVIDMDQMDMYEPCKSWFDNVQLGLLAKIMDKSIMQEDNYKTLLKDSDAEDYKNMFMYNAENFNFVIVTTNPSPNPELVEKTYTIEIGGS